MPDLKDRHDIANWVKRYESHRSRRSIWDAHWREVAERAAPGLNEFWASPRNQYGGGEKRTEHLYDVTAAIGLDRAAGIFTSVVIPQQTLWHRLRATDKRLNDDETVKSWFEEVNQILFDVRGSPKANFYAQGHEGFMSILAFGNHCQFVDEMPKGGVRYRNVHIGQVCVDVNHQGQVDTIYRQLPLSAKAAMQKWRKVWGDNPPAKIKKALDTQSAELFEFLHIVAPRDDLDPESLGPESKPWLSLYIFPEDTQAIEEGAFEEFPYMYPRWALSPMEVYGRGALMTSLPANKVLQEEKKTLLRAGHNTVDPPVLMATGGLFGGARRPKLVPGGPVMDGLDAQGRPRLVPFHTDARLDLTRDMMEDERQAIRDSLFLTLFEILTEDHTKTATEVLERAQEKGQMLAPAIGRLQSEWLGPQIARELAILGRQGLLPPLPDILLEAGSGYDVEYVSPATRLQRSEELVAIQRTWDMLAPQIALDPKQALLFKTEDIGRRAMDILGGPSDVLRTPEEFAEVLAQMAQAEQQAQQAAMVAQGATTLKDGASALSLLQGGANAA